MEGKIKANGRALLPIIVFLVIFLGSGFVSGDFNSMPAIVGFFNRAACGLYSGQKA